MAFMGAEIAIAAPFVFGGTDFCPVVLQGIDVYFIVSVFQADDISGGGGLVPHVESGSGDLVPGCFFRLGGSEIFFI